MNYYGSELEQAVIQKAHSLLTSSNVFLSSTAEMQLSFFPELERISDDKEKRRQYDRLMYTLKAIRQDYAKILVMMNSIHKTYTEYQTGKYKKFYYELGSDPATDELGCYIEYLFAKYRVILQYIRDILHLFIPLKMNENEKTEYKKFKKGSDRDGTSDKGYEYYLKYISGHVDDSLSVLNLEWFLNLIENRNSIIHKGATCLVYGDKSRLLFNVFTTDALDLDKENEPKADAFYTVENGRIDYNHYWGLHISKLIVFFKTIWEFLLRDSQLSEEQEFLLKYIQNSSGAMTDAGGNRLPTMQDVLVDLLENCLMT